MMQEFESRTDPAPSETSDFTTEDEKVIQQLRVRLRDKKREPDD